MKFKMTEQRMLAINIGSRFVAYTINIGFNFFLTPYIVAALGAASYGYFGLGKNFISYLDIVTFMTAGTLFRYVMIAHTQNRKEEVNAFFSTSFYTSLVYMLTLLIPVGYAIYRLQDFIKVAPELVHDVQILFVLMLFNFFLNTVFLIYRTATNVVNKLYLVSIRDFFAVLVESAILISLYVFLPPKIYYLGISTIVVSALTLVYDYVMLRRFMPEVEFKLKHVNWKTIKELTGTGFYFMIRQISNILLIGLDLLFANTFVSALAMGQLAVAKILPQTMQSFLSLALGSFSNMYTKLYAQKRIDHLILQLKRGVKVLGSVTMLPNVILIVYGLPFYRLWIPEQNVQLIYILSVLTALVLVMTGLMYPMSSLFTITNRLKVNALVHLVYGAISVLTTLAFLYFTDYGLYAIAGVSTFYGILLPFVFQMPYAAKVLDLPLLTFFPLMGKSLLTFGMMLLVGFGMSLVIMPSTWIELILSCGILGIVSVGVIYFFYFTHDERKHILSVFGIKA